ncbi:MAG: periplasmic nitrate reductase, electron transfer subunit [Gammaproteobacteria bacterium]|nr:MAG: periplasmic nitrate reductase, electron transfer subunit [Gammaproteobacteria bacterium]
MKRLHRSILAAVVLVGSAWALAQGALSWGIRGAVPVPETHPAPEWPRVEESATRRARDYPMQPPTIPHKIDNYQVDLNAHKCMSCHSRRRVEESGAPMVSVTHYMDRDGNFLAEVSPRRYFCTQCHVVQHLARPPVDNDFKDVGALITEAADRP